MQRKSLSDILHRGDRDKLHQAWDTTQAADEFAPLPSGEYGCHVISGEPFTSRHKHTAGYKLKFKVLEGEYAGRQVWHDLWLTPAALPMAKRDLAKLGVTKLEQIDRPLPRGIRCTVTVAERTADDGTRFNHVRNFAVIGIDPPDSDPFAPEPAVPRSDRPASDAATAASDPIDEDEKPRRRLRDVSRSSVPVRKRQ